MRLSAIAAVSVLVIGPGVAAVHGQTTPDAAAREAIGRLVDTLYAVISGPAGPRDWDRFRDLFVPGARLIPASGAASAGTTPTALSVEEYIARAGTTFARTPFHERETGHVTEVYGHIAHRLSAYESRSAPEGSVYTRGINSIQCYFDGVRWWIVTILWDDERTAGPIPDRLRGRH